MHRFQHVRMAEWSKAPDSRLRFASLIGGQCENSGPRMRAWVQIPLLTKTFLFWLSVHYYLSAVSSKSHEVAWPSGLRRWFKAPVSSGAWVRIPPLPKVLFDALCLSQKYVRGHTDLNHGPIGLQPIALPLSYIPTYKS